MVAALRVAFFGTPEFAVPTLERLLRSRHTVVGVVTQPDRPRGRGQRLTASPVKALASSRGLPIIQPVRLRDPQVAAALESWEPHLGVVAAYGRLIPDRLLAMPPLGMINVHASILPKYRGAAPVHRAVMAGETITGVTIMRVVSELDAGGILARATRPIAGHETSVDVERALSVLGAELLVDVADALADGTAHEEPQDSALATYAPKITREEGLIDWSRPARAIHDQVRGLYPWPHAHSFLDGARIIVLRTRVDALAGSPAPPGTIHLVSRDALHVVAGDARGIAIERLQREGKRPMDVKEFLAGHAVACGARFASS